MFRLHINNKCSGNDVEIVSIYVYVKYYIANIATVGYEWSSVASDGSWKSEIIGKGLARPERHVS